LKKTLLALDRIYNLCVDYLFYIACVLVIMLMLVVVADATLRYTVKGVITWAFDASEYSLPYMTFLATTWLLRKDGHVKLDVLINALKSKSQAYLNFIATIILVLTCIMLVIYGITTTIDNIQNNVMSVKSYSIPMFIFIIIIPIGSFLLLIQALKKLYHSFRLLKQS
jgi:C4-dicarboxylate transporter DctQ subunit